MVESTFAAAVAWLKLILEVTGAVFVGIGGLVALGQFLRTLAAPGAARFTPVRLQLARYLSLALEFQLAADIVGTTLAPTWQQIGKLGAIAVIRTGLNYFLGREMREEKATITGEEAIEKDVVESRAARPETSAT